MTATFQQMLERLGLRLAASSIDMILQVAGFGCAALVVIQLMTMWGTRWGDRNSLLKSLLLSVLVHICIVLEWNSVSPRDVDVAEKPPIPSPEPVRIVFVPDVVADQLLQGSGPFTSIPQPLARPAAQLPQMPDRERIAEPRAPNLDRSPRPKMIPTAEVPRLLAEIEEPQLLPQLEKPLDAQPISSPASAPGLASIDIADESVSRTEQRPVPRLRKPTKRATDPLTSPEAPAPRTANRKRAATSEMSTASEDSFKVSDLAPDTPTAEPAGRTPSAPVSVKSGDLSQNTRANAKPVAPYPKPQRIVHGFVKDGETGAPLAGVTVRIDQLLGTPLSGITTDEGRYEIPFNEVPDNVAVTATLPGYLPVSKNLDGSDRRQMSSRLNFTMYSTNDSVIAIEDQPAVHHLGDDRFEGQINSQFQRRSEGTSIVLKFKLPSGFRKSKPIRASVSFMAKGVQCAPKVLMNGKQLIPGTEKSASDGSFSPLQFAIDPGALQAGENQFEMIAVKCLDLSDLDDFEFVNVQVRLSRGE